MKTIELDGVQHQFPDDFSDDEIAQALGSSAAPDATHATPAPIVDRAVNGPYTQKTPDGRLITRVPTPAESKPMDWAAAGNAAADGAVDMATFNQGNKLDAYLESKTGIGGTKGDFDGNLLRINATRDAQRDAAPGAYFAGGIAGAYANPVTKGVNLLTEKAIPAAGGLLATSGKYLARMGQGAVTGGMYGAGFAPDGQATEGAVKGAIGGAATAGLLQAGADALGPLAARVGNSLADSAPMTKEQFKAAAQQGYKAAGDAGVVISPDSFGRFANTLPAELKGYHPTVNEPAARIVKMLQDEAANGPMTLEKLDALRSVASGASMARDPADARLAGIITGKIDDFIDNLKAPDLVGGDAASAETAANALTKARSDWRTYSKLKTISDIVDTGEMLNNPNWVKGRFAALVKSPSFDRYTDSEQQAISNVARTGNLEKALKLIPWRGLQMASTYAEPFMQDSKISSLQNLLARGGVSSSAAPAAEPIPMRPPSLLNGYGGLMTSQLGQRRQASGQ